jgi:hypothetical protein
LFKHGQAVLLRQSNIKDDRVIGFGIAEKVPLLPVTRAIDGVAGFLERGHELAIEIGIIFDDQDAHVTPFPVPAFASYGARTGLAEPSYLVSADPERASNRMVRTEPEVDTTVTR